MTKDDRFFVGVARQLLLRRTRELGDDVKREIVMVEADVRAERTMHEHQPKS